jgi:ABC-type cobalamin/Fe3+-siderophores transport system ATPase subunit
MLIECSGGNRRKVSAALAFMANPALVFLDEPTTVRFQIICYRTIIYSEMFCFW